MQKKTLQKVKSGLLNLKENIGLPDFDFRGFMVENKIAHLSKLFQSAGILERNRLRHIKNQKWVFLRMPSDSEISLLVSNYNKEVAHLTMKRKEKGNTRPRRDVSLLTMWRDQQEQ